MLREYIKHRLIGTWIERPLRAIRDISELRIRHKYPELGEIFQEGHRIDEVLAETIVDGMNCVDIGGHLGSITARFVRHSPSGHHLCVEPVGYKARWLRAKFPGVAVLEVAVGERHETTTFYYQSHDSGFSSLRPPQRSEATVERPVECTTLDHLLEGRTVDFIKIDIEGGELLALRGATRVLAAQRPAILFECSREGLERFEVAPEQVYSALSAELGYSVFLMKDWLARRSGLEFASFDESMTYPYQAFNFLAVHPESKVWARRFGSPQRESAK